MPVRQKGRFWQKFAVVDSEQLDRLGLKTGPMERSRTGTHALSCALSRDTQQNPSVTGPVTARSTRYASKNPGPRQYFSAFF
jgi:hypothetical protein